MSTSNLAIYVIAALSICNISPSLSLGDDAASSERESFFSPLVFTLSPGIFWSSAGQTQTLTLATDLERAYVANSNSDSAWSGELFVGVQRRLLPELLGEFGVAVARAGSFDLSGVILEEADPIFDNYTYNYKVSQTRLALKGKVMMEPPFLALMPYLSAGLGLGFNQSHDYSSTPTIEEAVAIPAFAAKTSTSFTYSIGFGIERLVADAWRVGVGFEFADWGKTQLGAAPDQTQGEGPVVDHVRARGVLVSVSYQLGGL